MARLEPVGALTGQTELTACLILCAPSGMTQAERGNWLKVARGELAGIPEDLLKRGAAAARKTADHPSKIVPAIFREVGHVWEDRKRHLRQIDREIADLSRPALPKPEVCSPEDAARIIAEVAAEKRVK